jgi:toxin ParE1/3/4
LKHLDKDPNEDGPRARKKPLEVQYLPLAETDLLEIIEYIRKDNPRAAQDTFARFEEALGKLASFPGLGAVARDDRLGSKGYRVLIIDNYLAFYVVDENLGIVEVRRVLHGRRRYSFLL